MEEAFEAFMTGRYGGIFVMGGIAAAIVLLLRALYGPRGLFRDPRWNVNGRESGTGEKPGGVLKRRAPENGGARRD